MHAVRWSAALVGALLLVAAPARAEGVFAREALGEWIEGYDLRGEALGGTGIGIVDPFVFSTPNPASGAFSTNTLGYAGIGSGARWTTDGPHDARRGSTYLTGTGLYLPLRYGLGLRLGLTPATDPTYHLEGPVATGWETQETDVRREAGSRGLTRYEAGLAWRGSSAWAIGAGLTVVAGSLLDETIYAFGDSAKAHGWAGGSDRRRMRIHPAASASGGLLLHPISWGSLGGFFSTAGSSDVEEDYRGPGGADFHADTARVQLPLGVGGGAEIRIARLYHLSADLVWRRWEETAFGGAQPAREAGNAFRNTLRWGVGIERAPIIDKTTPLLGSITWRAGYARVPWYVLDRDGTGIDEWRLSAGAGVPIQRNRGSLDLTFVYGRRGSLATTGLAEKFFRFGFSANFARVVREY
jgi:hypothetical protein